MYTESVPKLSLKYPKIISKVTQKQSKSCLKVFQEYSKISQNIPKIIPKSTFTKTQSLWSCEFTYKSLGPPDQPTDRQTRNEKPLHGRPLLGPAFEEKKL